MPLLYPYQYIKILSPNIYRIGINDILKCKLIKKFEKDKRFEFEMKNINTPVFSNNIICNLYNNNLISSYIFFTPYTSIIINKNTNLINQPKLILNNKEQDNWLFDIKTNFNYKFNTYN